MYTRKESTKRIVLSDGTAMDIRIMDTIMIEDIMVQHMKAEAWRIVTNEDRGPSIKRDVKDFLIRLYTIT